jgi:hypothetical protein
LWPVYMRIALSIKMADNSPVVLSIIFHYASFTKKTGEHVLTPKIGKNRLRLCRSVRPGSRGGLTRCPVASLVQRDRAV